MITICVPTYRGAARVDRILSSVRKNWNGRVIVRDDGTPDEMEATEIQTVGLRHRAAVIHGDVNLGAFANYSRLLQACETPLALIMDDDTIYPSGLAELATKMLEACPSAGMLSWVSENTPNEIAEMYRAGCVPLGGEQRIELDTELSGCCSAYRIENVRAVDYYDETYRCYYGDSDLAIRLTKRGNPCFRVHWPVFPHVEHSTMPAYTELWHEEQREKDLMRFVTKWGADPRSVRDDVIRHFDATKEIEALSHA